MADKRTDTLPHEEQQPAELDFSALGGRIKPDGTWPTAQEWYDRHAMPADMVFDNDAEITSLFHDQIEAINAIVEASSATRETVIQRLFGLVDSRLDIISNVTFEHLPIKRDDDEYAPESRFGDYLYTKRHTFAANIDAITARASVYPKLLTTQVGVTDRVVEGLAMPHSISLDFVLTDQPPWMFGSGGGGTSRVLPISVILPGKDNDLTPTQINRLYKCADPEAIEQTLAFARDLTQEIFGEPEDLLTAGDQAAA